ncbi:hypothetical protein [Erwinia persicina]|uniref:hypothetical protein n=1 Tax=Erwinia persicina TaxID=55211 RepID=UPI001F0724E8|nr:hypothetical protein [Erwinia persicina]
MNFADPIDEAAAREQQLIEVALANRKHRSHHRQCAKMQTAASHLSPAQATAVLSVAKIARSGNGQFSSAAWLKDEPCRQYRKMHYGLWRKIAGLKSSKPLPANRYLRKTASLPFC